MQPSDSPQPGEHPLSRSEEWEARTAWPLLVLSLLFVALSTVVFSEIELPPPFNAYTNPAFIMIWVIFFADFMIRLSLARRRLLFIRRHIFELISLLLPLLRPFLLVIYVWRLPALRRSAARQRMRYTVVAVAFGLVFVYVASTLVWIFEHRAPEASIVSFGDAIWWGFTTITTVGYGDYTPVTVPGRTVAVGLMLGGMVIVAFVTATVLSTLTDQFTQRRDPQQPSRLPGSKHHAGRTHHSGPAHHTGSTHHTGAADHTSATDHASAADHTGDTTGDAAGNAEGAS